MLIDEYIRHYRGLDSKALTYEERLLKGVLLLLKRQVMKYRPMLKTRCEADDIAQDLIAFTFKCIERYKPEKCKFSTYLTLRLRDFNSDFITKYYGIKCTRHIMRKYKERNGAELKIYFEEFKEIV